MHLANLLACRESLLDREDEPARAATARQVDLLSLDEESDLAKVVLQRVSRASVSVDGQTVGAIERGLLLLVGIAPGDGEQTLRWMAEKIVGLRVFPDEGGLMNRSLLEVGGRILAVSQFTLLGTPERVADRASWARPRRTSRPLFDAFVERLAGLCGPIETGKFGAHMRVELVNDGPVTLILER